MGLRGALGRTNPGADIYLKGTVPAEAVVSVYGSHLRKRATRVKQCRRPRRLHPHLLSAAAVLRRCPVMTDDGAMRICCCAATSSAAPGREAVIAHVPRLQARAGARFRRRQWRERGAWLRHHRQDLRRALCRGVDVITTGNHVWDRREIIPYIDGDPRLLRPINFPPGTPGKGYGIFALRRRAQGAGGQCDGAAVHGCDRRSLRRRSTGCWPSIRWARSTAILVDFHGEATSRRCRWGISATAAPRRSSARTATCRPRISQILAKGTAYMTDAGMCGDYDQRHRHAEGGAVARFVRKMPGERLQVAEGEATLCARLRRDRRCQRPRARASRRCVSAAGSQPHWPLGDRAGATVG